MMFLSHGAGVNFVNTWTGNVLNDPTNDKHTLSVTSLISTGNFRSANVDSWTSLNAPVEVKLTAYNNQGDELWDIVFDGNGCGSNMDCWMVPESVPGLTLIAFEGCFSLSIFSATLLYQDITGMSVSACQALCVPPYDLVILEIQIKCYCAVQGSLVLPNPFPDSACDKACPGDSSQWCGDLSTIGAVYTYSTSASSTTVPTYSEVEGLVVIPSTLMSGHNEMRVDVTSYLGDASNAGFITGLSVSLSLSSTYTLDYSSLPCSSNSRNTLDPAVGLTMPFPSDGTIVSTGILEVRCLWFIFSSPAISSIPSHVNLYYQNETKFISAPYLAVHVVHAVETTTTAAATTTTTTALPTTTTTTTSTTTKTPTTTTTEVPSTTTTTEVPTTTTTSGSKCKCGHTTGDSVDLPGQCGGGCAGNNAQVCGTTDGFLIAYATGSVPGTTPQTGVSYDGVPKSTMSTVFHSTVTKAISAGDLNTTFYPTDGTRVDLDVLPIWNITFAFSSTPIDGQALINLYTVGDDDFVSGHLFTIKSFKSIELTTQAEGTTTAAALPTTSATETTTGETSTAEITTHVEETSSVEMTTQRDTTSVEATNSVTTSVETTNSETTSVETTNSETTSVETTTLVGIESSVGTDTTAVVSTTDQGTVNVTASLCECICVTSIVNMTSEELNEALQELKEELTVSKTELSSYKRKLISAPDSRQSAANLGA
ncbi:mucin-5AC-like [Pecten maximus]|uniref:mucin-5AC-like n=1 Tax=Pecten maximus TaxID=6579 RepID=UPI001458513A|nr:mucin-5AC-like [Pecten maximus]